jgi:hypothetical protein
MGTSKIILLLLLDKPFVLIAAKGLRPGVCSRACRACIQACVLALASVCAFCLCCGEDKIKYTNKAKWAQKMTRGDVSQGVLL